MVGWREREEGERGGRVRERKREGGAERGSEERERERGREEEGRRGERKRELVLCYSPPPLPPPPPIFSRFDLVYVRAGASEGALRINANVRRHWQMAGAVVYYGATFSLTTSFPVLFAPHPLLCNWALSS